MQAVKSMGMTVSAKFTARKEQDMQKRVTHNLTAAELNAPLQLSTESVHWQGKERRPGSACRRRPAVQDRGVEYHKVRPRARR